MGLSYRTTRPRMRSFDIGSDDAWKASGLHKLELLSGVILGLPWCMVACGFGNPWPILIFYFVLIMGYFRD